MKKFLLLSLVLFLCACSSSKEKYGTNNYNESFMITNITEGFYFMDSEERNSFFRVIDSGGGEITNFQNEKIDEWFGNEMLLEQKMSILLKAKKQYELYF